MSSASRPCPTQCPGWKSQDVFRKPSEPLAEVGSTPARPLPRSGAVILAVKGPLSPTESWSPLKRCDELGERVARGTGDEMQRLHLAFSELRPHLRVSVPRILRNISAFSHPCSFAALPWPQRGIYECPHTYRLPCLLLRARKPFRLRISLT